MKPRCRDIFEHAYIDQSENPEPGSYITRNHPYAWDDQREKKIVLYNTTPTPEYFTWRGNGEMCELYPPDKPATPETVVNEIWSIAQQALPYLSTRPLDELQVTSFPPYHTFPDCEERFWEKFKTNCVNRRYLWSLIKKPWGSEGLKR